MTIPKVLLVTGFHRSVTSVTANYLLNAGLDMGSDLMEANISNAKGHFEDWDAVRLHDQFLVNSGTSWQFHDECKLRTNIDQLQQYIQQRNGNNKHWGVKDPRACLFLNEWHKASKEQGRYLFIVRHWSSCIESLLHRHSRDLSHQLTRVNVNNVGLQLWLKPELAAQMWLSYNKRILAFAKAHPDKILLTSQRALFEDAPILASLNKQFGFTLNTNAESPFQPDLLRDQASDRVIGLLSESLKSSLDSLWYDLLSLCAFQSKNEEPVYIEAPTLDSSVLKDYQPALALSNITENKFPLEEMVYNTASDWLQVLECMNIQERIIEHLGSGTQAVLIDLDLPKFIYIIDENHGLNDQIVLAVANLLMRIGQPRKAISYFQLAITLGVYFPYFDMLIGQCYQQLARYKEAQFFFDKAIKNNPNNPIFYTNKAKFLLLLDNKYEAELAFKAGYQKGANQPGCVLPYCEYLLKNERESEAVVLLEKLVSETDHPAALNMLTRIKLTTNYQLGKVTYLTNVKTTLQDKDTMQWLAQTCGFISNSASENDFIIRAHKHWQEVFNS
jgi:tetratricopeptide (TPR) repeat protein